MDDEPPRSAGTDPDLEEDDNDDSKEMGDLLAKFYGVDIKASDGRPAGANDDNQQNQREGDYSGSGGGGRGLAGEMDRRSGESGSPSARSKAQSALDVNSEAFKPDAYVKKVLHEEGIQGLLEEESTIKNQVRSLESDMQMLVYENYNKFISATDMIRQMKANVESMDQEMKRLTSKMSSISNKCEHLETALEGNRDSMENLVGVSRLLQRLQFLFELPHRLNRSIEMKAYAQAVRYYKVSHKILFRYKTIASFSKISSEAAVIIARLTGILKNLLHDPNQNPLTKMENAGLLLELHEPPENLATALFQGMGAKLSTLLDQAKAVASTTTKPTHVGKGGAAGPDGKQKDDIKGNDGKDGMGPGSRNLTLSALEKGFLSTFVHFATMFQETFHGKFEGSVSKKLRSFSVEAFEPYFALVIKTLHQQALIRDDADATDAAKRFRSTISQFYKQISWASSLVSGGVLVSKAAQVIENAIRLFADAVMDHTLSAMNKILLQAYTHTARLSIKEELVDLNPSILKIAKNSENDAKDVKLDAKDVKLDAKEKGETISDPESKSEPVIDGETKTGAETDADQPIKKSPIDPGDGSYNESLEQIDATQIAMDIRKVVEESLVFILPVLDTGSYLPTAAFIGLSVVSLARAHLHHVFAAILTTLQVGCAVSVDGPGQEHILCIPDPSKLQALEPSITDRQIPLFLLLLSQICDRLHSDHIEQTWRQLKSHIENNIENPKQMETFQRHVPQLLADFKAVSQSLLKEYANIRGICVSACIPGSSSEISSHMSANPIELKASERTVGAGKPCPYVLKIFKILDMISRELGVFFTANVQKTDRTRAPRSGRANKSKSHLNPFLPDANRGIERMFRERVNVVQHIEANTQSPLQAILRILAKAFAERLRLQVLAIDHCLQIQLDLYCIRLGLPTILEENDPDVENLVDEAVSAAEDRTRQDIGKENRLTPEYVEQVFKQHFGSNSENKS